MRSVKEAGSARQAAKLQQLQPEGFEPCENAVHGGLVWEAARQQRIPALRPGGEGGERAQHFRPEVAADADLIVLPLRIALLMRAPAELRFVFASRRDPQLGLHRQRLDGELTEIRAADLRLTPEESRDLLEAAGVRLSDPALALLHERTEGWAAGLRLAALSLAGHPDPELFAAEFPAASAQWPSTS
jgi:hypothetical protein